MESVKMNLSTAETKEILCNDMRHLGIGNKFDCKFVVGCDPNKETIYGCKYVFSIESPVFEKMLLGDFREAKDTVEEIPLPEDDPKALRHFRLLACSNDRMPLMEALTLDDTMSLTKFCHKYMALSLTKLCIDRLMLLCADVTKEDALQIFCLSRLIGKSPLDDKVDEVLEKYDFPIDENLLNDMNQNDFKDYINYLGSVHSANMVFHFIQSYTTYNEIVPKNLMDNEESGKDPEEKAQILFIRDLLNLIRFEEMNISEFIAGPGASNLLTYEQKYVHLSLICRKRKN